MHGSIIVAAIVNGKAADAAGFGIQDSGFRGLNSCRRMLRSCRSRADLPLSNRDLGVSSSLVLGRRIGKTV
jgi:hypothetical protein